MARVYMCVGVEEARKAYADCVKADPLQTIVHAGINEVELCFGNNNFVQTEGLRVLRAVPEFHMVRWVLAMAFINDRRPHDAIQLLRSLSEKSPTVAGQACRFLRLALEGQPEDAKSCFDPDLLSRARNVEFWSFWVSECYAYIDEKDLAIDWLETEFRKGFWHYPYISKHSTAFRKLDGHPRFEDVLARENRLATLRTLSK